MDHRRIIELVVLGLWLSIGTVIFYGKKDAVPEKILPQYPVSEIGKNYEVIKITVVRGDSFDVTLKDGNDSRILAKLPVMAVENSKGKVIDVLNHSTKPRVVLRDKQSDGRWMIDLFFEQDGKEINLSDWLVSNKLVYK